MNIELLVSQFIQLWNNASDKIPDYGVITTTDQKKEKENALLEFSKKMRSNADIEDLSAIPKDEFAQKLNKGIGSFLLSTFSFTPSEMKLLTANGFMGVTQDFMEMAREFDSEVSIEDIFQASRNL